MLIFSLNSRVEILNFETKIKFEFNPPCDYKLKNGVIKRSQNVNRLFYQMTFKKLKIVTYIVYQNISMSDQMKLLDNALDSVNKIVFFQNNAVCYKVFSNNPKVISKLYFIKEFKKLNGNNFCLFFEIKGKSKNYIDENCYDILKEMVINCNAQPVI